MKKAIFFLLVPGFFVLNSWKPKFIGSPSVRAVQDSFTPPTRTRGKTRLNVRNYGAIGNGIKDDTDAFQRAIDALPQDGGTVFVPSGNYLINGDLKDVNKADVPGNCIRLRSNMHLELASDAILKAKPTDAYATRIIYAYLVNDVEISGGKLIGERGEHMSNTGEYGHGIHIKGCNGVTIRNIHLSNFWGDGVCIGSVLVAGRQRIRSNDVVIDSIISTNNRRQGLSIGPATNVQVWNSEFSNTNGTAPQCGIDIEPEKGQFTDNVLIQNCVMKNNHAYGILLWKRVSNVTIKHCEIVGNNSGVVCEAPAITNLAFNQIHNNRHRAIVAKDSVNNIAIVQNIFYENNGNVPRASTLKISGVTSETDKDVLIRSGVSNVNMYTNTYK